MPTDNELVIRRTNMRTFVARYRDNQFVSEHEVMSPDGSPLTELYRQAQHYRDKFGYEVVPGSFDATGITENSRNRRDAQIKLHLAR